MGRRIDRLSPFVDHHWFCTELPRTAWRENFRARTAIPDPEQPMMLVLKAAHNDSRCQGPDRHPRLDGMLTECAHAGKDGGQW